LLYDQQELNVLTRLLRTSSNIVFLAFCAAVFVSAVSSKSANIIPDKSYPTPPNDLTRVYYLSAENKLLPLPFEPGITSLNVFVPAEKDRITHVDLKSPAAETVLSNNEPRFYVFIADRWDPPPHQLVRLTSKKSGRQLTVSVLKGRKGYAPFARDNVSLEYRLLERLRVEAGKDRYLFVNYMQLRPLTPLAPGEYAVIGDSLADMATFRVQ
jgi:hypothetical protein